MADIYGINQTFKEQVLAFQKRWSSFSAYLIAKPFKQYVAIQWANFTLNACLKNTLFSAVIMLLYSMSLQEMDMFSLVYLDNCFNNRHRYDVSSQHAGT